MDIYGEVSTLSDTNFNVKFLRDDVNVTYSFTPNPNYGEDDDDEAKYIGDLNLNATYNGEPLSHKYKLYYYFIKSPVTVSKIRDSKGDILTGRERTYNPVNGESINVTQFFSENAGTLNVDDVVGIEKRYSEVDDYTVTSVEPVQADGLYNYIVNAKVNGKDTKCYVLYQPIECALPTSGWYEYAEEDGYTDEDSFEYITLSDDTNPKVIVKGYAAPDKVSSISFNESRSVNDIDINYSYSSSTKTLTLKKVTYDYDEETETETPIETELASYTVEYQQIIRNVN